jgi:hypothetical protein
LKKKGLKMVAQDSSAAFIKEYQEQFEKLKENEIALLERGRAQLNKIANSRPDSLALMQIQIFKIAGMMVNRINITKKEENGERCQFFV